MTKEEAIAILRRGWIPLTLSREARVSYSFEDINKVLYFLEEIAPDQDLTTKKDSDL